MGDSQPPSTGGGGNARISLNSLSWWHSSKLTWNLNMNPWQIESIDPGATRQFEATIFVEPYGASRDDLRFQSQTPLLGRLMWGKVDGLSLSACRPTRKPPIPAAFSGLSSGLRTPEQRQWRSVVLSIFLIFCPSHGQPLHATSFSGSMLMSRGSTKPAFFA